MKDNPHLMLSSFIILCEKSNKPICIGVDPGSDGAIGFVCGRYYAVVDIPNLKVKRGKGKKTVFNLPEILNLFRRFKELRNRIHAVVEQPPPSMGPKSSGYAQFRLGVAYAMWPLFLMSKGYRVEEVSPHVWKKFMGLNSDKETSRHKALGLFSKAPLARKKDHNRAEGLMLAEYLARKLRGVQHDRTSVGSKNR